MRIAAKALGSVPSEVAVMSLAPKRITPLPPKRLHGGQPAMAKQVEVVGGDHPTAELVDLGALWRGVAREEGAVEDNVAPEIA